MVIGLLAYIDPTGGLPPNLWAMMLAMVAAALGVAWASLKMWGRQVVFYTTRWRKPLLLLSLVLVIGGGTGFAMFSFLKRKQAAPPGSPRVLVLGFDGLDPQLLEKYMAEGRLPNFAKLKAEGVFHPLETTNPPQSPVAWASFITGTDPGHHGIFDFLKRDPKTYLPDLTIADRKTMALPWKGTPFWDRAPLDELGVVALRLPVTFANPPPKLNGRLLAGMGVYDLRGTEGTYFYYRTQLPEIKDPRGMLFELKRDGGAFTGEVPGPYYAGGGDTVREPFRLELKPGTDGGATLKLQGKDTPLLPGRWSDWIGVEFRFGTLGLQKARGITRAILTREGEEVALYVSPLNFDPVAPMYAITSPKDYAGELAKAIGPYHTRGMPFDTQAVNDGVLSDAAFLEQCRLVNDEGEKMMNLELARFDAGVLFAYFEASDIIQHMFWRGIDPEHPLADSEDAKAHRDAIPACYEQFDAILGRARAAMGQRGGAVVVISDHGFAPFRRSVHVNSILRDLGYLALKATGGGSGAGGPEAGGASPEKLPGTGAPGIEAGTSKELFDNVDWTRTKAYAVGFNTIFLNLAGREGQGIVPADRAEATAREIAAKLEAFADPLAAASGVKPIRKAYTAAEAYPGSTDPNRPDLVVGYIRGYRGSWETALGAVPAGTVEPNAKKWSGDHLMDPREVPGVFLSSDPKLDAAELSGVGSSLRSYLALSR